ncbi:MAG TPA: Na+/H+ antiporter subunit G [Rhizobiaceae bacterium]|nr:Na+/H+ antiporter subunit G [Rhizobiaceae bacterium]
MELWQELLITFFLVAGGFFGLVGSFGMIKLPSPMARLHAPTKATTLGIGGVLLASMFHSLFVSGTYSFHELLITLFLFLTAPISAHFIAKMQLHETVPPETLPDTGTGHAWAGAREQGGMETRTEAG